MATVTAAFATDPAWSFLLAGDYERRARLFAGALFDARVGSGDVWVKDDCSAVAMWESPHDHEQRSALAAPIWARYREEAGADAAERLAIYDAALDAAAPGDPFWYLGTLATAPQRQRQGLATAVIAPVLEQADEAGVRCCLETSTEANRRFYERRGFTQVSDVVLPEFAPPTWWLQRPVPQRSDPSRL